MIRGLCLVGLAVVVATSMAAPPVTAQAAYDLMFRDGTLDDIDSETTLVYRRDVTNTLKPEAAARDTGKIALSLGTDDAALARLEFRRDGKHRALGRFPASVGNPMIMYFYETTVRDMAEAAGGSPHYIRNRIKEALVQPNEKVTGEARFDGRTVPTVTVNLSPFADDPNRERMQGFGDLTLSITMSDSVPGWYLSLVATTGPTDGAPETYRSELVFERLEPGR